MKKNITLSIPVPCRERWETFTATTDGGYCSSCRKSVVDFTLMTDAEVIDFVSQKPNHTCGRFRTDQLRSHAFALPGINPSMMLFKVGLLSLLLVLVNNKPSTAQGAKEKPKAEVTTNKNAQQTAGLLADTKYTVRGTVFSDEDSTTLAGVNVVLQGTTVGTTTDANGLFVFPKELEEGDVLLFSFVGFDTQEFPVSKIAANAVQIRMTMNFTILGELQVSEEGAPRQSRLRGIWGKVKGIF